MEDRAFVASGSRVKLAWALLVVLAITGVWNLYDLAESTGPRWILRLVAGVSQLGVVGILAWGVAHRKRPIIEVSGDTVGYASIYWFGGRKCMRFEDITRVALKGRRLELTTRAGKAFRVWLGDLSQHDREAARKAIDSRLRTQGAS